LLGLSTDSVTPPDIWNCFIQGSDLLGAEVQVLDGCATSTEAKPACTCGFTQLVDLKIVAIWTAAKVLPVACLLAELDECGLTAGCQTLKQHLLTLLDTLAADPHHPAD
jgi:hypothetical protein